MIGLSKISYVRRFECSKLNGFCVTRILKTRIFTANVWLINDFATQLYRIFLKTNIFLKTERKKLIRSEFKTYKSFSNLVIKKTSAFYVQFLRIYWLSKIRQIAGLQNS